MGDFTPDGLDSRSPRTPWEWENRVLLEEYYIFNVVIPPESSIWRLLESSPSGVKSPKKVREIGKNQKVDVLPEE